MDVNEIRKPEIINGFDFSLIWVKEILLDEDAYDNALNIYRELNVGSMYNRIKLCLPPDGEDPSSVFAESGVKGVCELLKTSYRIPESRLY